MRLGRLLLGAQGPRVVVPLVLVLDPRWMVPVLPMVLVGLRVLVVFCSRRAVGAIGPRSRASRPASRVSQVR